VGKYLDILNRADVRSAPSDISDQSDRSYSRWDQDTNFGRFCRFGRAPQPYCHAAIEALQRRCPAYVEPEFWHQTADDARRFLSRWGEEAEALGWTARDLFGLPAVPDEPHPSYRRLSRYDQTGLIWLLRGRTVVALTESTAAVESATGMVTVYRKHNKPALGPLGDTLEDLS
jgi:hypothetical protein